MKKAEIEPKLQQMLQQSFVIDGSGREEKVIAFAIDGQADRVTITTDFTAFRRHRLSEINAELRKYVGVADYKNRLRLQEEAKVVRVKDKIKPRPQMKSAVAPTVTTTIAAVSHIDSKQRRLIEVLEALKNKNVIVEIYIEKVLQCKIFPEKGFVSITTNFKTRHHDISDNIEHVLSELYVEVVGRKK
ncbi:MAG: hypothetical protein ACHQIM_22725 [Sphingobacteriales bacterium]